MVQGKEFSKLEKSFFCIPVANTDYKNNVRQSLSLEIDITC